MRKHETAFAPTINFKDRKSATRIAFNGDGSILWGITGDGATNPESLFTINKTTGAATLLCALGNGDNGESIAFNPDDSMIYHISGNTFESDENQFFEKVNPSNWAITNIGFANEPFDETIGLAYAGSGSFIMADWDELFSLNGSTGAISSIGSAPDIMKGLAYADFTLSLTNLSLGSLCRRSGKSNLQVRYVIDNLSLTNANDAVLSFTSNSTFVSDSLGACSVSGSVVTCNIGDVPSGASVVLDVFSTVSFKRSTPVSNNARISSDEWETPGDVQNNYHNFNDKCSGGPIN